MAYDIRVSRPRTWCLYNPKTLGLKTKKIESLGLVGLRPFTHSPVKISLSQGPKTWRPKDMKTCPKTRGPKDIKCLTWHESKGHESPRHERLRYEDMCCH